MRRRAGLAAAKIFLPALALALPPLAPAAAAAGQAAAADSSVPSVTADSRAPAGPVASRPVTTTPHLLPDASPPQQVRQLVQCRGTMFAVGSFSRVERGSRTYIRHNAMSFGARPPYAMSSWAPRINGKVNSITFDGSHCADAYIGGSFTRVDGAAVRNIAEVSTRTGAVVKRFAHSASKMVDTLLAVAGHILAGGEYRSINGTAADPYLTSLNPRTGRDDGYLHLHISGNYRYPHVAPNATKVYNQALSHSRKLDLVMGDFTSAGRRHREQIFMLSLGKARAAVTGWTSPEWDGSHGNLPGGYPYQCARTEPFYIRSAAWSRSDKVIYIAATGDRPWNVPATAPRSGLCDSASAFPATARPVLHMWVNYTGCDSLYSAAADSSTAYFAGHERWSQNPHGCNRAGPGAIDAPGIEGLSPATGALTFNPTRARGLGADDMLITPRGLWIASDDYDYSQMCGGVSDLAGICLLPYRNGAIAGR